MADSTEYYSLIKPADSDLVDIDDLNGNFDKIDQAMKENADALESLNASMQEALSEVQESLVFDDEPLDGSGNPVTSGGIKEALDGKQDILSDVFETGDIRPTDFIFLERGGTIFKCLAEKIMPYSDLLVTESGDILTAEDGEVLLFDSIG